MKILIFGINGFVGNYLYKELISNNHIVTGADIAEDSNVLNTNDYYSCDITDQPSVDKIIKSTNPDCIINLAAISSVGQSWKLPQKTFEINVLGALNILESVKEFNSAIKILFIGSSEQYAPSESPLSETSKIDALNPYGASKSTQEQLAKMYAENYGMNINAVRAFNHTGVGQNVNFVLPSWIQQVAKISKGLASENVLRVGNVEVSRDFADVRDIVKAYRLIIESNLSNEILNVGSGKSHLLKDLLNNIVELSETQINIMVDDNLFRPSDNPFIQCDYSKINNLLGWEPIHDILETIKEMYENFLETL